MKFARFLPNCNFSSLTLFTISEECLKDLRCPEIYTLRFSLHDSLEQIAFALEIEISFLIIFRF
jgi:hypothetical protein